MCPNGVRVTGIESIPNEVQHVLRLQVIQEIRRTPRASASCRRPGSTTTTLRDCSPTCARRVPGDVKLAVEIAHWLERTPRGKTPLIVHRPPVHEALRRAGVEPVATR